MAANLRVEWLKKYQLSSRYKNVFQVIHGQMTKTKKILVTSWVKVSLLIPTDALTQKKDGKNFLALELDNQAYLLIQAVK